MTDMIPGNPVIGINKKDKITSSGIHSNISSNRNPFVVFMDYANTSILLSIFIGDLATAIWSAVINKNQFDIAIILIENGFYTFPNIFFDLIDGSFSQDFLVAIPSRIK